MEKFREIASWAIYVLVWALVFYFGVQNNWYFKAAIVFFAVTVIFQLLSLVAKGRKKYYIITLIGYLKYMFISCAVLAVWNQLNLTVFLEVLGLHLVLYLAQFILGDDSKNQFLFRRGNIANAFRFLFLSSDILFIIYAQSIIYGFLIYLLFVLILVILLLCIEYYSSSFLSKWLLRIPSVIRRENVLSCSIYRYGKVIKIVTNSKEAGHFLLFDQIGNDINHLHLVENGSYAEIEEVIDSDIIERQSKLMLLEITKEAFMKLDLKSISHCDVCAEFAKMGFNLEND